MFLDAYGLSKHQQEIHARSNYSPLLTNNSTASWINEEYIVVIATRQFHSKPLHIFAKMYQNNGKLSEKYLISRTFLSGIYVILPNISL